MHRAGRNRNGSRTTFREIWSSSDGSPQAVSCRRRTAKFKSNVRETWRVILVSEADIFVAVHLYCSQQRDFADASHSKSAKSAARAVSYGIFSSENSYMQVKHLFCAESLRILAERLSQSETQLPLRQICYYSPPEEVGVFSTEISCRRRELPEAALAASQIIVVRISIIQ